MEWSDEALKAARNVANLGRYEYEVSGDELARVMLDAAAAVQFSDATMILALYGGSRDPQVIARAHEIAEVLGIDGDD